ncbi:MAG: hypothetical protein NVS3B10_31930 [Polyangiales bacterium]
MRRFAIAFALSSCSFVLSACGAAQSRSASPSYAALPSKRADVAPPPPPGADGAKYATSAPMPVAVTADFASSGGGDEPTPEEAASAGGSSTTTVTNTGALPAASTASPTATPEMLDVEARLTLEVAQLSDARAQVRRLVEAHHGTITEDTLMAGGDLEEANFAIRVPSSEVDKLLDGVNGVGKVRAREVKARDVGKEYHDDLILLENLKTTMKRYEEILAKADKVSEILQIEGELARIRGQVEQVQGTLRWLKDRTSRSTVYLRLVPERPGEELHEPTAKLYPGLRANYLIDVRNDGTRERFVGFGLSLHFARAFSIDLDGMRRVGDGGALDGLQAFIATMGGDFYSDFFGGGKRRWFNPYLGARVGYARILGENDAVATGVLGLEVYRSKNVMIDVQGRLHGFFGNPHGAHVGVQPSVGINLAF